MLKCPTKNTPADNKERLDLAYNTSVGESLEWHASRSLGSYLSAHLWTTASLQATCETLALWYEIDACQAVTYLGKERP